MAYMMYPVWPDLYIPGLKYPRLFLLPSSINVPEKRNSLIGLYASVVVSTQRGQRDSSHWQTIGLLVYPRV
jgi:hypothetical protein